MPPSASGGPTAQLLRASPSRFPDSVQASSPTHPPTRAARFGGEAFPPEVLFKVFLSSREGTASVVYLNGKTMIQPASEVGGDARAPLEALRRADTHTWEPGCRLAGARGACKQLTVGRFDRLPRMRIA